jgi:four helix bundle protein
MTIKSFRDLVVWQNAMKLAEGVYGVAGSMPATELYGLTRELKRSAVSIPSNIAEGKGRGRTGHFVNHLIIALGSEAELQTQVELAVRLGFIAGASAQPLLDAASEIGRMLNGLIASLEASKGN